MNLKTSNREIAEWEDIIRWEKWTKMFPNEDGIYRKNFSLDNEDQIDRNNAPT